MSVRLETKASIRLCAGNARAYVPSLGLKKVQKTEGELRKLSLDLTRTENGLV